MENGFYRTEMNKATWELPERYQDLQSIGSGAYGLVWYIRLFSKLVILFRIHFY